MKKLYTVLFVVAMSLLVSCDRENSDGISNEMAIKMSVSVDKTKAILTTDNIINTSIGVFGYKEQISNQNNKYLVFNNEQLSFESDADAWAYSPVRYWDTQTAYSFIAYAPFDENNVEVHGYSNITINAIQQWQDADDAESKDYVVALTNSAATNYINNGGVDLKFHHILANLKISAFKEGDSDFKIQNITIGADIDKQRVPSKGTLRSYLQNFNAERADGDFIEVEELSGNPVLLFEGNMAVEQATNVVANLLVAPFTAGADLPLTITYTENGTKKSAVVNSGITEFKSDAVYTVNLKFTATSTPEGPSGPGVEAVVDGFAIGDGNFDICLAVDDNGKLSISNINSVETSALIWNREYCEGGSNEFYMSCTYNGKKYYLSADNNIDRLLVTTENLNEALKFHIFQYPNKNPNLATYIESEGVRYEYLVQHTQDHDANKPVRFFLAQEKGRDEGQMMSYNSIAPSEFTKLADFCICKVEDGFAGPLLYFQEYTNNGYDYLNRCLDINKSALEFKIMMSQKEFSLLSYIKYNNNLTHYYYEGAPNVNTPPVNYITDYSVNNNIESIEWTVTKTDGTTFDDNIVRVVLNGNDGGKLEYLSLLPTDTDIIVSATVNFNDQTPSRTATYRLTLKGANSSN